MQTSKTNDEVAAHAITLCKAAGDPIRLHILRVMRQESLGVLELSHIFDIPQPGMSHHLKILVTAGLLQSRREGANVFYRRALIETANPAARLHACLLQTADEVALPASTLGKLASVHAERASSSRAFFARHAPQLRAQQALIAEFEQYKDCLLGMLERELLPQTTNVLEVGPGDSELLPILAGRFASVTALDNSAAMLVLARQQAQDRANITFVDGELDTLKSGFGLIVFNMVLHHMPSPGAVFVECRRLLQPGGVLLLADLCPHDQDWARQTCGDRWLGFDPSDISHWARSSGLDLSLESYLGLKNGFQVQVRTLRSSADAPDRKTLLHKTKSAAKRHKTRRP